jgi:hypothetical protein
VPSPEEFAHRGRRSSRTGASRGASAKSVYNTREERGKRPTEQEIPHHSPIYQEKNNFQTPNVYRSRSAYAHDSIVQGAGNALVLTPVRQQKRDHSAASHDKHVTFRGSVSERAADSGWTATDLSENAQEADRSEVAWDNGWEESNVNAVGDWPSATATAASTY